MFASVRKFEYFCIHKEFIQMNHIPTDPFILLSFINTKLRDEFPSLNELCAAIGVDESRLCEQLRSIGMEYDKEQNRFW